ncbi:hypothetical protein [Pedobacter sp.]|uniref:hypothetical protein n=1 Tax=Pedobacter sp. TaxID=1411316 RepID=UPI003D7F2C42
MPEQVVIIINTQTLTPKKGLGLEAALRAYAIERVLEQNKLLDEGGFIIKIAHQCERAPSEESWRGLGKRKKPRIK